MLGLFLSASKCLANFPFKIRQRQKF
jgi:hypothetical protein